MSNGIIYEKKYSHLLKEIEDIPIPEEEKHSSTISHGDAAACARRLLENTVCVLQPERMERLSFFIDTAKDIGDLYLIDTTIIEHENRVSVTYSMLCDASYQCLKRIILLADDLRFQSENDAILISLDYYTHATYCSGRRISPLDNF